MWLARTDSSQPADVTEALNADPPALEYLVPNNCDFSC